MYVNRGDVRNAVPAKMRRCILQTHSLVNLPSILLHFLQLCVLTISDHQFIVRFNLLNHVHRIRFTVIVSFLFIIFAILILIIGDRRFTEKFGYDVFPLIVRLGATHVTRWNVIENSCNNFTVIHVLKDHTYTLPIKSFSQ